MNMMDWTTPEYLANMAAEELSVAMLRHGIEHLGCFGDEDGDVAVSFGDIHDAEALMTLTLESNSDPGSLYDRATSSCVTLVSFVQDGAEPTDQQVADAVNAGWVWVIHPDMRGRRMGWHVRVDMPHADAYKLTSLLNAARFEGQS